MQLQNPVGTCSLKSMQNTVGIRRLPTYNPKSRENMQVMQPQNPAGCQPAALKVGRTYMQCSLKTLYVANLHP